MEKVFVKHPTLPGKTMNSEMGYILYEGFLFQIVGRNTSDVTIILDGKKIHIPTRQARFCSLTEFLNNEI
ncbi:hypothetical protein [Desertivirga brevis]|uniref:hypothetical protein n=1 Tax=Desertivirga brevis TaxID=2810310 RepID=UPI001A96610E|nr:hypothetical protein [Pedobacter sp. SYSU D00873]